MDVDTDISTVLTASLVQVTVPYFPAQVSGVEREKAASIVRELISKILHTCQGVVGLNVVWSIEDNVPVFDPSAGFDQAGAALILLVGWSSIEARAMFVSRTDFMRELRTSASLDSMVAEVTRLIECRAFGVSR